MPKLSEERVALLTTLHEKVNAGAFSWRSTEDNSYTTSLDGFRIDVDKRLTDAGAQHVVWVFGQDAKLIDRVYERDAAETPTEIGGAKNFAELIKLIFISVSQQYSQSKLKDVLQKLKEA